VIYENGFVKRVLDMLFTDFDSDNALRTQGSAVVISPSYDSQERARA
jgi:hypothetical protein